MPPEKCRQLLESDVKQAFTRCIGEMIVKRAKGLWEGCLIDHPSKMQQLHVYLAPSDEKFALSFAEVIKNIAGVGWRCFVIVISAFATMNPNDDTIHCRGCTETGGRLSGKTKYVYLFPLQAASLITNIIKPWPTFCPRSTSIDQMCNTLAHISHRKRFSENKSNTL